MRHSSFIEYSSVAEWRDALGENSVSFLQHSEWGSAQAAMGSSVRWFSMQISDGMIGAQIVEQSLGLGRVQWYIGDGPVCIGDCSEDEMILFLTEVSNKAHSSVVHVRVEPSCDYSIDWEKVWSGVKNSRLAFREVRPQHSVTVSCHAISEEDLLASFKSKTRYNIRLAKRRGVNIVKDSSVKSAREYCELMKETAERDQFSAHSCRYYETLFQTVCSDFLTVYWAEFEGRRIASLVAVRSGDTVSYLYGASSYKDRSLMAPFLLQWTAIQDAYAAGAKYYDFYGTSPLEIVDGKYVVSDTQHSWASVSRFKLGFVPSRTDFSSVVSAPDSYDIVLQPLFYRALLLRRFILRK